VNDSTSTTTTTSPGNDTCAAPAAPQPNATR
jgi:hypothetical protein